MSPNNGILFNVVLKLLNNPFAFCSFINLDFLLFHIANLDNNIDLPFLVFITSEFTFSVLFCTSNNILTCLLLHNGYYTNNCGVILFKLLFLIAFCLKILIYQK